MPPHWEPAALEGPLFEPPEEGGNVRVRFRYLVRER